MHEVCVKQGWCGGVVDGQLSHVTDFIPASGTVAATQFVEWLFKAEGVDPSGDPHKWQSHKDALRAAFIRCIGSETVDAQHLRWA